ncbi:MAG: hypothetical protein CVV00_12465 [Firmicutes bacterium HGW-Firmicutes-5]|jgi:transcriptional regulator with XRE-family HTH domain|nr:MAG: hypothetical protein CVV00_12465 [Firmicutes bacterium HGW-Firmicutes-5]
MLKMSNGGMIVNRIKHLRSEKGWTQTQLGDILKVKDSAISKYESEKVPLTAETIKELAKIFDVTTDYLLCVSDDPKEHYTSFSVSESLLTENEEELLEVFRKVNERQQIKLIGRIEEIVKQIVNEETNRNDETGGFKSDVVPSTLSKKEVG